MKELSNFLLKAKHKKSIKAYNNLAMLKRGKKYI